MSDLFRISPKGDYHTHLDGSIRPATFLELQTSTEYADEAAVREDLCFKTGWGLPRCLKSFSTTLTVLQKPENVERVAYELCQDMAADGVTDLEIRYCPSLHLTEGMDREDVVAAVYNGLERANRELSNFEARQIVTILRNYSAWDGGDLKDQIKRSVKEAELLVELAVGSKDKLVVGIDIAGNEYDVPPELLANPVSKASRAGLNITIHAGEDPKNVKNVRTAVRMGAKRIGHGIAAALDTRLMQDLKDADIFMEFCPTSNIHTGAINDYADHPIGLFLEREIPFALCADNTLLSNTSTSQEYRRMQKAFPMLLTDVILVELAEQSLRGRFGSK